VEWIPLAYARDYWLVRENMVWNIHFSYEAGLAERMLASQEVCCSMELNS
jgi:hypothetical protein